MQTTLFRVDITQGKSCLVQCAANKSELLQKSKEINIPVHGPISITLMAKYFIDNKYFQRLNKLKQLGTCDFIFPGAIHTRFEHSIGTYYLAGRLMNRIKMESDNNKIIEWLNKIPELKSHYESKNNQQGLNSWIIELVKIAALCHDLGHGPYSHLFDDVFIKRSSLKNHPLARHEQRSCMLVKKIVEESNMLSQCMTDDDVTFIQSLIDPNKKNTGFIYQIVSNNSNDLDVDKIDYLSRDPLHCGIKSSFDFFRLIESVLVIDDRITYPEQAKYDIHELFKTRHSMHCRVYCHKGVISAQFIIIEIMMIIDKILNIAESILNPEIFNKMTDSYILNYMEFILEMKNNENNPFKDKLVEKDYADLEILQKRLQTHNLYVHIGTITTREQFDVKKYFDDNNHVIFNTKIGFVSGNKLNPLDNIYIYTTKDLTMYGLDTQAHKISKTDISFIIPEVYQEYVTMVFRRDRELKGILGDKELFQSIKDDIKK